MGTKYRKLVPPEYQDYWLYKVPDKEMVAKQNELKREAKKRKRNAEIHQNAKNGEGYYLTGTVIRKKFEDGKLYEGVVSRYTKSTGFYTIQYDDGDVEEFDESKMRKYFHAKKRRKE